MCIDAPVVARVFHDDDQPISTKPSRMNHLATLGRANGGALWRGQVDPLMGLPIAATTARRELRPA